jgi:PAS domain S-box-containing protein
MTRDLVSNGHAHRPSGNSVHLNDEVFRQLAENIREVFWVTTGDGARLLYISPAYEEIWGRQPGELYEDLSVWRNYVHPADLPRLDAVRAARLELTPEEVERLGREDMDYRIVRPDGSIRWVRNRSFPIRDESGKIYRFVGLAKDVTEQKRVEHALRDSETFHRLIAELASDYAYSCGVFPDGSIRMDYATEGFTRVTGYTVPELSEQGDWPKLIHPDDLAALAPGFEEIFAGKRSVHELRIVTKWGAVRWIRYSTMPLRDDPNGPVTRLIGAVTDITEQKEAEKRLQDYAARLQLLSRRLLEVQEAERRHIARELHDEVGQLLTGLRLSLEAERLSGIRAASESPTEIVRELAQRVRDLSLDLRPTMLDDLGLLPALLWLVERYTAQTQIRVKFEHRALDRRLGAETETAAFRIVQEALTNVARHAGTPEAEVDVRRSGASLSVRVLDRGRGFDPISVARKSSGLSGMRERAELVGGSLHLDASPQAGCCIVANLPCSPDVVAKVNGSPLPQ